MPVEFGLILLLTTLNIRGVRESVITLLPVFLLFLVTHALVIGGGILAHLPEVSRTVRTVHDGFGQGIATLGVGGLLLVFVRAYSLGGGTYTGIEAVSNGLPIMREPKVETGKRTMVYMGSSLAFTASGLLLCYLLWQLAPGGWKDDECRLGGAAGGRPATRTCFHRADAVLRGDAAGRRGPGWVHRRPPRARQHGGRLRGCPHRFAALSERLTTQNGILLMGGAALAALLYTRGDVGHLVVMYSINVFLTFSLSMLAMLRFWTQHRATRPEWKGRLVLFAAGFVLCVTILVITVYEKFAQGGWVTTVVTALLIGALLPDQAPLSERGQPN